MTTTTIPAPKRSGKRIKIAIEADIVPASYVRRCANAWLLMNVGNLLGCDTPRLILDPDIQRLHWQLDIKLSRVGLGIVGIVGSLTADAATGNILEPENLQDFILQLNKNASAVLTRYSHPTN